MKIREPEYYSKFKCIADRCPDTCCRYWQVELDEEAFSTIRLSLDEFITEEDIDKAAEIITKVIERMRSIDR